MRGPDLTSTDLALQHQGAELVELADEATDHAVDAHAVRELLQVALTQLHLATRERDQARETIGNLREELRAQRADLGAALQRGRALDARLDLARAEYRRLRDGRQVGATS